MTLFLLVSTALAVEPVVEDVGAGQLNWTTMRLEVSARSDRTVGAWKNVRVQEQDALDRLEPLIEDAARRVRFDPQRKADDLLTVEDGGVPTSVLRRLDDGLKSWRVRETRYLSNGGVEMDGVLEVHRWLRPMLLSQTDAARSRPSSTGLTTGVLIDARHLDFQPCLAPELLTTDGRALLHPSKVHPDVMRRRTPVVYVQDPADPVAADRAGEAPIFLIAAAIQSDCQLSLDAADSKRLSDNTGFAASVTEARVVIVVNQ